MEIVETVKTVLQRFHAKVEVLMSFGADGIPAPTNMARVEIPCNIRQRVRKELKDAGFTAYSVRYHPNLLHVSKKS